MIIERQNYLDGLRAIAIAGVVLVHSSKLFGDIPNFAANASEYGAKGVQLFFVVSGFTLGLRYLNGPLNSKDFYIRRFFRIAPMFYISAIFYALLGQLTVTKFAVHDNGLLDIVMTATFLHGWLPETINHSVPGGWSIGAEAMFYAIFPVLYFVFRRAKTHLARILTVMFAFIIGIISFVATSKLLGEVGRVTFFPYFFWITQLPAFVLGLALSQMRDLIPRSVAAPVLYATLVALFSVALIKSPLSNFFIADIWFGLLVLSASVSRPPLLENRFISYIGEISFSIYLVHFAVVDLAGWAFPEIVNSSGTGWQLVAVFAGVSIVSIAISSVTYQWIEQPMIAVGRRVAKPRKTNIS